MPPDDPVYETALQQSPKWALSEGSRHFEEQSAVFQAMRGIAQRLDELRFPYAIIGPLAFFHYGYRRFTEDVEVLVRKSDLRSIHDALNGRGYLSKSEQSKHLRDTQHGVRIKFSMTGDYPGDTKPKPVQFPDPIEAGLDADGIRYLKLEPLVELMLTAGITNPGNLKDLADVFELIKTRKLPREFADSLHSSVRAMFLELWEQSQRRYARLWRRRVSTPEDRTFEGNIKMMHDAVLELQNGPLRDDARVPDNVKSMLEVAANLEQMQQDGLTLEYREAAVGGVLYLVTTDPAMAKKYGLIDESEYWDDEASQ